MPRFSYIAIDPEGETQRGVLRAGDEREALDRIAALGLTPYRLTSGDRPAEPWWAREVRLFGGGPAAGSLTTLFRTLALFLEAKLPLETALALTRSEIHDRRLRPLLDVARAEIAQGGHLAEALEGRPDLVPARFVELVRVGEETNRLAETARRAARLAEGEARTGREIRDAVTYPLILLAAALLVLGAMVFLLAPTLAPVFDAVRSPPPWSISAMLAIRSAVIDYWPIGLVASILAIALVLVLMQRFEIRRADIARHLPILGSVLAEAETVRLLTTLSLLIESRTPLDRALRAVARSASLTQHRAFFELAGDHIASGGRLAQCLTPETPLPETAQQMIRIGEESNRLPEMLAHGVAVLSDRAARRTKRLVGALTPVLTVVIGLVAGGLIFSTLSAVLDANDIALR